MNAKVGVRWLASLLIFAAALLAAQGARANTLTIYNTGVDNSGTPLSGGSADPHYTDTYLGPPSGSTNPAVVMTNENNFVGGWAQASDAKWINCIDSFYGYSYGSYDYRITFDLTGYDPSTATLSGKWTCDDDGSINLNGVATGISLGYGSWGSLYNFTINSGFVAGTNTLDFLIVEGTGIDGLLVSDSSLMATTVPIPAALPIFGSGLVGLLVWRRFRKS